MSHSPHRPPRPSPDDAPVVTPADLDEARALYAQLDPAWFDDANDPEAWLFEPDVQRLMNELVDAELLPFAAILSDEELRVLREEMLLACHVDPVTIEYLRRIRPRADRDSSGKTRKGVFQADAKVVALPTRKAGGERS